jgi:hypothetical protein
MFGISRLAFIISSAVSVFFSELCTTYTILNFTRIALFDISFNAFRSDISTVWQCLPPQLQTLTQLYLGNNSFTSTSFTVDFGPMPMLALLDVSNNSLSGTLLLPGYNTSNAIFNATGNFFTCPMPLISAGQLALFSPCLPDYHQIYYYLEILGCVVAGVACIGLFVYCVKWHDPQQWTERQNKVFIGVRGWVSFFAWIFAGFNLYSDVQLLWRMQHYVLSEATNCAHVNDRSVFFSFMPYTDAFLGDSDDSPFCSSFIRYFSSAGPNSPVDPTIPNNISKSCFRGFPFSLTPPPLTQLYTNYSLSLQEWQQAGFKISALDIFSANNAAFTKLCQRFSPYCHVITESNGLPICTKVHSDSQWSSKANYGFLILVLLLLTYKLVLEAGKLGVILVSMWRQQLWQPSWTLGFITNSPFLLLLIFADINPWHKVLMAQLDAKDWRRLFVYDSLLCRVPMLGLTFWYIRKVTQQGLQPFDYFSLFGGMFSIALAIRRARKSYEIGLFRTELNSSVFFAAADHERPGAGEDIEPHTTIAYVALEEKPRT